MNELNLFNSFYVYKECIFCCKLAVFTHVNIYLLYIKNIKSHFIPPKVDGYVIKFHF